MPPKAVGTPGKDDVAKELKDLQFLLTCIQTSTNVIQVNYDELTKELKNQGLDLNNAAIRKRVGRMSKALGVMIKGSTGAVSSDGDEPQPKLSPKKSMTRKKRVAKGSDDQDEASKSPSKKQKPEAGADDNDVDAGE